MRKSVQYIIFHGTICDPEVLKSLKITKTTLVIRVTPPCFQHTKMLKTNNL